MEFSSLTVRLGSFFIQIGILNPAVVVVEVFLNLYVLFINLNGVPTVWKRCVPILVGMLPGYRRRSLCSCFASTRLGQILDLIRSFCPHPAQAAGGGGQFGSAG